MKTCKGCQKVLQPPLIAWCSGECREKNYKRKTETGVCAQCGISYEYESYRKGKTKFCSPQCVGKSSSDKVNPARKEKRVELTCGTCGIKYLKAPYAASRSKFCSRSCQSKSLVTSRTPGKDNPSYKHGMGKYRREALAFYGNQCKVCHANKNLHVHHRDADRMNNDIKNLIPLCTKCHSAIHGLALKGVRFSQAVDACPTPEYYTSYVLPLIKGITKKKKEKKEKEIDL